VIMGMLVIVEVQWLWCMQSSAAGTSVCLRPATGMLGSTGAAAVSFAGQLTCALLGCLVCPAVQYVSWSSM
jgi:hypothetical protein